MNRPRLIAIVDDDEAIVNGLSRLLRSAGHATHGFTSAEAFLGAPTPLPDCVLTDVQMPGMNGLELQAALQKSHPAIPVLFMTAFPEEAIRERALAAGAKAFFNKPFEADALLQAIANCLQ